MTDKNALADHFGLQTFDTALPQDWVDAVTAKTGDYAPHFAIVWCYDGSIFGYPVALDAKAAKLLARLIQTS